MFFVAEFCFIVLIGICRLDALHRPLSPVLTTTIVKCLVLFVWVASMIYVGSWPITSIGIFYEPLQNLCIPWLQPTASSIFLVFHFVIMAIIFITNVAILYLAKRHSTGRKSVQKATLTVSMVCWVFVGRILGAVGGGKRGARPPDCRGSPLTADQLGGKPIHLLFYKQKVFGRHHMSKLIETLASNYGIIQKAQHKNHQCTEVHRYTSISSVD